MNCTFTVIQNKLLIMTTPENINNVNQYPSFIDQVEIEKIIDKKINWSNRSQYLDITKIMGFSVVIVTFEIIPGLTCDFPVDIELNENDLIEIAENLNKEGIA